MWQKTEFFLSKYEGQSLVEYVLIISLVSILIVVGLQAFQGGLTGLFQAAIAVL